MTRPDGGGGGQYSMIDPVGFAAMVSTLSKNADTLQSNAALIQSDLDYFGIAPGDMTTVLGIAAWMHDQLPGLRRRQAMAEALARDVPKNPDGTEPMVFLSEPVVSAGQAAANGQANAKALQKWLQDNDGTGEIDPALLADLNMNESDPAYTQAFYDTLGPQQTQELLNALQGNNAYEKDATGQQYALNTLAKSFETTRRSSSPRRRRTSSRPLGTSGSTTPARVGRRRASAPSCGRRCAPAPTTTRGSRSRSTRTSSRP